MNDLALASSRIAQEQQTFILFNARNTQGVTARFNSYEFFQCTQHDLFSLCGCIDCEQVAKVLAVFASVDLGQQLARTSDRLALHVLPLRKHVEAG